MHRVAGPAKLEQPDLLRIVGVLHHDVAQHLDAAEAEGRVAAPLGVGCQLVGADPRWRFVASAVRTQHVEAVLRACVVHPLQKDRVVCSFAI